MSQRNSQRRGEATAAWRRPIGLLEFIVVCTVLGVVVWLITTYVPMPQPIKTVIVVAVVLVLVLVLVRALVGDIQIPRLR